MAKIVGLRGKQIIDTRQPNAEAVKKIEWLAEAIRSGEIVGFAAAYIFNDEATGSVRAGLTSYGIAGRLSAMQRKVFEDLEQG